MEKHSWQRRSSEINCQCQMTCTSRLLWGWCSQDSTTAQRLLLVFRSSSLTGFSLCRMLLRGWFLELVNMSTCSHCWGAYTGFGFLNGFRSGWQCKWIAISTTLHLATWRQIFSTSQTSAHVGGCTRRLRQRSSPHAPRVLPSATEPSRRLLHLFEIVCWRQYVHRRHYQFSAEDWTFCPVLQLFCLMSVSLYWLLRDPTLLLRVLAVLGLHATSSQFVFIIIIIISWQSAAR